MIQSHKRSYLSRLNHHMQKSHFRTGNKIEEAFGAIADSYTPTITYVCPVLPTPKKFFKSQGQTPDLVQFLGKK